MGEEKFLGDVCPDSRNPWTFLAQERVHNNKRIVLVFAKKARKNNNSYAFVATIAWGASSVPTKITCTFVPVSFCWWGQDRWEHLLVPPYLSKSFISKWPHCGHTLVWSGVQLRWQIVFRIDDKNYWDCSQFRFCSSKSLLSFGKYVPFPYWLMIRRIVSPPIEETSVYRPSLVLWIVPI